MLPKTIDFRAKRVLIVEDLEIIRQTTIMILNGIGVEWIEQAVNGEAAWEVITRNSRAGKYFDLVISDIKMDNLDGLSLLKKVRSHGHVAKTPFVLLTSTAEKGTILEAIEAGVTDYVVKPFRPRDFESKIRGIFSR